MHIKISEQVYSDWYIVGSCRLFADHIAATMPTDFTVISVASEYLWNWFAISTLKLDCLKLLKNFKCLAEMNGFILFPRLY